MIKYSYFCNSKEIIRMMKKTLIATLLIIATLGVMAQPRTLTLEECHKLALESNTSLKIETEKVAETDALRQMALCEMFPRFSANGTYNWNQKSIQLIPDDKQAIINNLGTIVEGKITPAMTAILTQLVQTDPAMAQTLMGALANANLGENLNGIGQNITDALNLDLTNVWTGAVTVTQPVFMGGRLVEMYRASAAANEMARLGLDKDRVDLLIQVDEAYLQVVSVEKKYQLAKQYANLLDTMYHNVMALKEAEMANESDVTQVRVKLNEAQMSLAKAQSGLTLSKMLLCQLCGLPLTQDIAVDEMLPLDQHQALTQIDLPEVMSNRIELKLLEQGDQIAQSGVRIARAGLMPNLLVQGSYVTTNPSLFNGVQNEFDGMFTVGAVLNVPIAHPTAIYRLKAAKHKRMETQYQMEEAREKIELQVNKLNFELGVANTKLTQAQTSLKLAEENLTLAQESFKAGLISSSDLMAAQTAWLKASSELLDATIEVRMGYLYLKQALGEIK